MKIAFIGRNEAQEGNLKEDRVALARELALRGDEVFLYVSGKAFTRIDQEGIRLIHVPSLERKLTQPLGYAFLATVHALFQEYDIVHFRNWETAIFSFLIRLFRPNTRVIVNMATLPQKGLRRSLVYRGAEKFLVPTKKLQEFLEKKNPGKASVIPEMKEWSESPDLSALSLVGLRPGKYILAAALPREKNIHYLIKAFQELEIRSTFPNNFKLVIITASPFGKTYEEYLGVLCRKKGNVLFLKKPSKDMRAALFAGATLFVDVSEEADPSQVLLEAMAYGKAVIADARPNLKNLFRGNAGKAIDAHNTEALKKELAYYANRSGERESIGHKAKTRWEDDYSPASVVEQVREIYRELLKTNGLRQPFAIWK